MFRAYDPDRERLVAIKLFRLDLPPERVHRLVAELERLIAATPGHPGVVAPLATGIDDVTAYLAQEYVAAESLDVVLRQHRKASVQDSLRVAAQLAGALDAASDAGIDHGALHPRDVLLTAEETKVTGLGVARALERIGLPAPMRRPYAAPERTSGSKWDRRADVFGLAALVHEMLWGRRVSGTDHEAVAGLDEVEGADQAGLRDVFGRALASDSDQRFDTASGFARALAMVFDSRPAVDSQPAAARSLPVEIEPRLPLEPDTEPDSREDTIESVADDIDGTDAAEVSPVAPELAIYEPEPTIREPEPVASKVVEMGLLSYQPMPDIAPEPESDRPRSVVSPLAFALLIGAALGFAAGFGVGARWSVGSVDTPTAAAQETATNGLAGEAAAAVPPAAEPEPAQPAAAPPPPAAAPVMGSLLVRSTPTGAQVFVDGREYGRTPVTVNGLTRGLHTVRIARNGYVADERQLTITAGQRTQSVTVRLSSAVVAPVARPAPPAAPAVVGTGLLVVESRPAGARVFLNGQLVGVTPLELPGVPAGEQRVQLERAGYQRWASSVRVVPSERNRVAASLDR